MESSAQTCHDLPMAAIRYGDRVGDSVQVIEAVARLLCEYRVVMGLSQTASAKRAGVDKQTWMFAERGIRSTGRDVSRDGEVPIDHESVMVGKRAVKIVEVTDVTLVRMARAVGVPPHRLAEAGRPGAGRLLEGVMRAERDRLEQPEERVHPAARRLNEALWALTDDQRIEAAPMIEAVAQYAERMVVAQQRLPQQRKARMSAH